MKTWKTARGAKTEADEDIGTARIVARARKEISAGAPLIPKVVVDRIAKGESPLRVLREWRDVPQIHLSSKTDIGQGYLSDLENGRRKGTAEVWKRIAKVLNVPLELLV
jgi:predicted transcriptional regulator